MWSHGPFHFPLWACFVTGGMSRAWGESSASEHVSPGTREVMVRITSNFSWSLLLLHLTLATKHWRCLWQGMGFRRLNKSLPSTGMHTWESRWRRRKHQSNSLWCLYWTRGPKMLHGAGRWMLHLWVRHIDLGMVPNSADSYSGPLGGDADPASFLLTKRKKGSTQTGIHSSSTQVHPSGKSVCLPGGEVSETNS